MISYAAENANGNLCIQRIIIFPFRDTTAHNYLKHLEKKWLWLGLS